MSWLGTVASIINAAFPSRKTPGISPSITPPPGLEGASVSYVNEGRSGKVVFSMAHKTFAMYFEFGGGDTVATIDVPNAKDWNRSTGLSLDLRVPVLHFIGQCVVRDQTTQGRGRYQLHESSISIHA